MNITNTTRLRVKHLMTDMYKGHNIADRDKIDYAIDRVLYELEKQEMEQVVVGSDYVVGCVVPVADLFSKGLRRAEVDGKKCWSGLEENICMFAAENYATLIKKSTQRLIPYGCKELKDITWKEPKYTLATCRDMDGIFEFVY